MFQIFIMIMVIQQRWGPPSLHDVPVLPLGHYKCMCWEKRMTSLHPTNHVNTTVHKLLTQWISVSKSSAMFFFSSWLKQSNSNSKKTSTRHDIDKLPGPAILNIMTRGKYCERQLKQLLVKTEAILKSRTSWNILKLNPHHNYGTALP